MKAKNEWVYVITNTVNNKKYVGSSFNPAIRFENHLRALKSGTHICPEMQEDFDRFGNVFEYEVVGRNNLVGADHAEYTVMRALKTYDERFGYNMHDSAMKPSINNAGYLTAKASKDREFRNIPVEESDELGRLAINLMSLDEQSLILIKNGATLLADRQRMERDKRTKKAGKNK